MFQSKKKREKRQKKINPKTQGKSEGNQITEEPEKIEKTTWNFLESSQKWTQNQILKH
jgi:hypothetical protein